MVRRTVYLPCYIATLALLAGCSGSGSPLKTVPAGGTLKHNGVPVEGANVTFFPTDPGSGKPATGLTDSAGKFTLQTFAGGEKSVKGALVGDYTVIAVKTAANASPDVITGPPTDEQMKNMGKIEGKSPSLGETGSTLPDVKPATELLLPPKYSDPTTTDLKASVKAGDKNEFTFDLID